MRQRVLIAIALACKPQLLLADEPTSGLDVTVQRKVLDQMQELSHSLNTSVLFITHDLALAAERADRIVVMHRGLVVETGSVEQILHDPQEEYTKRLLAAAPSMASPKVVSDSAADAKEEAKLLIEVSGLTKKYKLRGRAELLTAVDGVNLSIPAGKTVAIVGESGSGKSTTARLILKLERQTSGTITYEGKDVSKLGSKELFAFRRSIQPVFQNPYGSLDPQYTIEQVLEEPLKVHKVGDAASRRETVKELLDRVALPSEFASRYPKELSGGQCQRVAIARALALNPKIVVLDEAVSALDVLVQEQILELMVSLQKEMGLSYLFISHDLAVVRLVSHYAYVMHSGKIVESGEPGQLFSDPQEEYTQRLVSSIPGYRHIL